MEELMLDRIARVFFVIGVAPCALFGFVASFMVPQGTFAEWLIFGGSLASYITLFLSIVVGFIVGGILAAPWWIGARIQESRAKRTAQAGVNA